MATGLESRTAQLSLDGAVPEPSLYPPIDPYYTGFLDVSDVHSIYYELSGNPDGLPICFVHGGPGGGTVPAHRRFFNPRVYKIILFDQRGCGNSTPTANLEDNSTWSLVADMEQVREAANVNRWVLFGGSWGSTLAVAYAQCHAERVTGLILRGIFMVRKQELAWLYERDGAAMLYPEAFQRYLDGLPKASLNAESLMVAYYDILSSEEPSEERRVAANAWSAWEHTLSSFPRPGELDDSAASPVDSNEDDTLAFSRIECHYFVNEGFMKSDGYLLSDEQMRKIKHIKTWIIQGRWDMVCPRKTAYDLAVAFEGNAEVVIVENSGHSTFEPGIEKELLKASDRFAAEFDAGGNGSTTG